MTLSYHDAELVYDGPIPAGIVDRSRPDTMSAPKRVRLVNVREKPAATLGRMVGQIARLALAGAVTRADLERAGFTAVEIEMHAAAALRIVRAMYPGLEAAQTGDSAENAQ